MVNEFQILSPVLPATTARRVLRNYLRRKGFDVIIPDPPYVELKYMVMYELNKE